MENLTTFIDQRIAELEKLRVHYLEKKDFAFANSTWARLDELKNLKSKFTDREGNWKETD